VQAGEIITMKHAVTLIPGDGIGPEITRATREVIEAAGVEIEWHEHEAGSHALEQYGTQVPEHVLNCIRTDKVCLKGPVTTPIGTGFTSANVILRKTLDLYACLRPARSLPGVKSRFEDVDLVVVRENTEGLYSGIEHEVVPGVVESLKIVTERASTRIAEFAFEHARKTGRSQVTAVHKANIMKLTDGLSLRCARAVAARYPEIKYTEQIIDAACMKLVIDPHQYEVLVMENLYGDIVSDLCAGLVGGLGVVPGANPGPITRVRGRARLRTGHRRQEPGEPDRPHPLGRHDAAPHRRRQGRRADRDRRPARAGEGRSHDPRPRRPRHHHRDDGGDYH